MLKTFLRFAARKVRASYIYLYSQFAVDRISLISFKAPKKRAATSYHLHLPATGGGNIGDQAMLDAYLQSVAGRVVLVLEKPGALAVSESDRSRVSIVVLPGIVSSAAWFRTRQMQRFVTLLAEAKSFSIAGADVMDGLYNASQSIARISMLRLANARSVPSSVLGFSWSEAAVPSVVTALRSLQGETKLYARDPKSVERLARHRISGVIPVADGVFSLMQLQDAPEVSNWIETQVQAENPFVVVNASGLIGARMDQLAEYGIFLDKIHELGFSVLYLPHVIRPGDDDLTECRRLFQEHARPVDFIIDRELAPSQIRQIVSSASIVITGRMHLAIMSLSRETPVITLGTQGKVEGLYEMFDLLPLLVFPEKGFGANIRRVIVEVLRDEIQFRSKIASALPTVRELASLNYRQFSASPSLSDGSNVAV